MERCERDTASQGSHMRSRKLMRDLRADGRKYDDHKTRYDLLPPEALEQWARVLTYGASKYGDRNWEEGIVWSRVFAAAQRHLWAWWNGEDLDDETGLSHLAHAMCCVGFLLHFTRHRSDLDNRPRKETNDVSRHEAF